LEDKMDTVKGFKDYEGEDAIKREAIRKIIVDTFTRYGYSPVDTPIIESRQFVQGDNTDDEAVSDIFRLKDKGDRDLALRYEMTFPLKRLMQGKKLPYKRFAVGPVFRDEPVSGNRVRQFVQCDIDTVGSTVKDEAETLVVVSEILRGIGITPTVLINNRKLMNEILEDFGVDDKDRDQVMREIDKFDKLPEDELRDNLRPFGVEGIIDRFNEGEDYFEKFESYKEVLELINYCKKYGLRIVFSPTTIRGLSYYNGSVFEIKGEGIKETITGGGSYIFNDVQCTGISMGLDRLFLIAKLKSVQDKFLIVSLGEDDVAIKLAQKLREQGKIVSVNYGKPSKALGYANAYEFGKVVFVGKQEVESGVFKVKDMVSGDESVLEMDVVNDKCAETSEHPHYH